MKDCVFCKIVRRELPADIVFENDHVLAFLDIAPINKGHTLVIPKNHQESPSPISDEEHMNLMKVASHIGRALVKGCDYDGYNLHLSSGGCAGQAVPHVHMHVVPRVGTDGFHWNWRSLSYEGSEKAEIIDKINQKMKIDEP